MQHLKAKKMTLRVLRDDQLRPMAALVIPLQFVIEGMFVSIGVWAL